MLDFDMDYLHDITLTFKLESYTFETQLFHIKVYQYFVDFG